jgi:2,4-diketo-3-deoxy-L-fuconate hydrolase
MERESTMRLVRIGDPGAERPGAIVDDVRWVDLSDVVDDFDETFFGSRRISDLPATIAERISTGRVASVAGLRFGPPIARPHQILGIGLNYRDHAEETGQPIPVEPIVFNKAPNTLIGPNDNVVIPRGSMKTDWEVELGIVMGSRASYLEDEAAAAAAIAGYVLVNDVSEREWQTERGGQWVKGKSAPTFNPAGPYLVTPDDIGDVLALEMWLDVDGVRRQTGSTSKMLFSPHFLVHYLSQFLTLEPGDLINTGTPPGVGLGLKPPVFLHGGETMTLGATRLGTQTQHVITQRLAAK